LARIKLLKLFDGPKEKKVFGFIEFLEENIYRFCSVKGTLLKKTGEGASLMVSLV